MKFIQFGCWNQNKCIIVNPNANPLSNVMYNLNSYISKQGDIDFLIVSGDNYYTEKKVNKEKEKEKIIHREDLISGLDCLPKNIKEINMILGNHDLETQKKEKPNLYLEDVSPEKLEKRGQCNTLNYEQGFIRNSAPNINYDFFISKYDRESQTLILMIDTSIYDDDDVDDMIPCYKYMTNFIKESDGIIEIRRKQEELIMHELKQSREIRNIIISGHHPLMYYKLKVNEKKPEKTKFDIIHPFPSLIELLIKIYLKVQELQQQQQQQKQQQNVAYYYLCADLHLYQQGKVLIPISSANDIDGEQMIINQYIVGTGGTELDKNPFSHEYDKISDGRIKNIKDGINKDKYEIKKNEIALTMHTNYVMTPSDVIMSNTNYGHGFLECTLDSSNPRPLFNFILVPPPSQTIQQQMTLLGGDGTKKYKKKKMGQRKKGFKKSNKKRTKKNSKRKSRY